MTRHTPGPWYSRHGQISSLSSSHGCTIANCNRTSNGISDEEVSANAALIAAAPEMFEELREVEVWLESDQSTCDGPGDEARVDWESIKARLSRVRAVLAKVTSQLQ